MNNMTIWQRLHTYFAILFVLLLIGFGTAWWVQNARDKSFQRNEKLDVLAEHIRHDITHVSDLVRAGRAHPDLKEEQSGHINDLKTDISKTIAVIQAEYGQYQSLLNAVGGLNDYASKLIKTNESTGNDVKSPNFGGIATTNAELSLAQSPQLFDNFLDEVRKAKTAEVQKTTRAAIGGVVLLLLILVACFRIGRMQSTAISKPLSVLVNALEELRGGDFSHRVALNGK